ncbi:MAG: PIN domain-containing protein, partial [Vicinamibacterales bacterium]|nr:PIN domain-containing protein [Vicinamibacterales bacterium]
MILLDTTPLVALCDERDQHHRVATRELNALRGETFATCEAVLAEACFHLDLPHERHRLRTTLRDLRVQVLPTQHGLPLWASTLEWMEKYAEHAPEWADAYIAVLSGLNPQLRV